MSSGLKYYRLQETIKQSVILMGRGRHMIWNIKKLLRVPETGNSETAVAGKT